MMSPTSEPHVVTVYSTHNQASESILYRPVTRTRRFLLVFTC